MEASMHRNADTFTAYAPEGTKSDFMNFPVSHWDAGLRTLPQIKHSPGTFADAVLGSHRPYLVLQLVQIKVTGCGHKVKRWLASTMNKTSMSLIPNDTGLIGYMT